MAHPYPSTPVYTTTPSYPAQQSYYPSPQSNTFQQTTLTPSGLPQQQQQQHQAINAYQPSPSQNSARFDSNSQLRPPAPPFPFPPNTFTPELLQQLAQAGIPPPPPPTFPPAPINNTGYLPYPASINPSASSPYPQHGLAAPQHFNAGFYASDQIRHNQSEPFLAQGPASRGVVDHHLSNDTSFHAYASPRPVQGAHNPSTPASKRHAERSQDEALPSFGSRSDLNMLFANARQEYQELYENSQHNDKQRSRADSPAPVEPTDGSVSPYDPTRPAAPTHSGQPCHGLPDSTYVGPVASEPKRNPQPYSLGELKQAAKDALLSLFSSKILYSDLVTEGIDPSILRQLYSELNLDYVKQPDGPAAATQAIAPTSRPAEEDVPSHPHSTTHENERTLPTSFSTQPLAKSDFDAAKKTEALTQAVESPIPSNAEKPQTPSNSNLERKDRIAQLLAARTGRANAASPTVARTVSSTPPKESFATAVHSSLGSNFDGASFSRPSQPQPQVRSVQAGLHAAHQQEKARTDSPSEAGFKSPEGSKQHKDHINVSKAAHVEGVNSQQQTMKASPGAIPVGQGQSGLSSLIPGLFMTTNELPSKSNSVTDLAPEDDGQTQQSFLKRPREDDLVYQDPLHQSKRPNLQQTTQTPQNDDASEGEIVEESDGEEGTSSFAYSKKFDSYDQQANAQLQDLPDKDMIPGVKQQRPANLPLSMRSTLSSSTSIGGFTATNNSTGRQNLSQSSTPESVQKQSLHPKAISKLTPAQLAEKAAMLKAEFFKQRARRQQVLQEELPDLDAEVSKTESRLAKARSQLSNLQADISKLKDELARTEKSEIELVQEVKHLEQQLRDGRSGQKQYSEELQKLQLDKKEDGANSSATESKPYAPQSQAVHAGNTSGKEKDAFSAPEGAPHPINDVAVNPGHYVGETVPQDLVDVTSETPQIIVPTSFMPVPAHQDSEEEEDSADEVLHTDEMEISPEPDEAAARSITNDVPEIRSASPESSMEIDEESDGSASMSDSGSEEEAEEEGEYEPAVADVSQPLQQSRDDDDDNSDEYDPEEVAIHDAPTHSELNQWNDSSHSAEPQATPGTNSAAIASTDEPIDTTDPSLAKPPSPGHESTDAGRVDSGQRQLVSTVPLNSHQGDFEQGTELNEANTFVNTQPAQESEAENKSLLDGSSPPNPHYIPYKTPLSSFKTYRFHQDFNDTVKSGYRSLTYSNSIDPSRPLCPTELSGAVCEDPTCEEQHFRQLGLSDDKILVQMSSASDIKDKNLRDQFLVGLKQVIAELRQKEVKEFESVANALSAYRRRFFTEREEIS